VNERTRQPESDNVATWDCGGTRRKVRIAVGTTSSGPGVAATRWGYTPAARPRGVTHDVSPIDVQA
jgi:hypothetical protein